MKSILIFLIPIAILSTSCHPTYQSRSSSQDDVYYSSKSDPATYSNPNTTVPEGRTEEKATTTPDNYSSSATNQDEQSTNSENNSSQSDNSRFDYSSNSERNQEQPGYSESTTDKEGNSYTTNNYYYNNDDYYDYAYSARLRRFNHPCGWGYYDNYYTNSYWYDYNPYSWGTSIYLGYSFWGPGYSTFYSPFYYSSWGYYHGYSAYNSGYFNGYQHGYQDGYWNGYYNGYNNGAYGGYYNPYYYNSYDNNTHYYYGPRGSRGRNTRSVNKSIGELYESNVRTGKNSTIRNTTANDGSIRNETAPIRNNSTLVPVRTDGGVKNNGTINNSDASTNTTGGIKPSRENAGDIRNNEVIKGNGAIRNNANETPGVTGGVKPSRENIRNENGPIRNNSNTIRNEVEPTKDSENSIHNGNIRNAPVPKTDRQGVPPRNEEYNQPKRNEPVKNEDVRPRYNDSRTREANPVRPERKATEPKNDFRPSQPQQNGNGGGTRTPQAPASGEKKANRPR